MLGSPILYLKGMRIMMFQLSGFYCTLPGNGALRELGVKGIVEGYLEGQGTW